MVVIDENIDDIIPLAKLGRELGVDYLVVKQCSDTSDGKLGSPVDRYLNIVDVFKEAEGYSTEDYTVTIKWSKLTNRGLKDYDVCLGTQLILAISASGDVFPCGHFFNIDRERFHMGNVATSSFRDIVASERYWEVQKRIQTLNVNTDCESNCRQHYINVFLHKLANPPEHVNFI
jgi:radical SAM protein with 4Fe4S-binding SPASM domain